MLRQAFAPLSAALLLLLALLQPLPARGAPAVGLLTIDGALGPATADHVVRSIAASTARGDGLLILLMTIGIYGLVFEFMSPGVVAPDVIGGICLLLGLYALQLLPVNYAGLALIALGLVFMGMEAFLPSFGVLGLGGIAAFIAGALMLIDTELPGYGIPLGLVAPLAVASALLLFATVRLALRTRRRPVTSGAAGLVGAL